MILVSVKTGKENNANLLKIGLSDGSSYTLKNFYLNYFRKIPEQDENSGDGFPDMEEGRDITEQDEEAFRFASSCYKAEKAGMRLIARAEQTTSGLARKLEAKGHGHACVSAAVEWFIKSDLINDERFSESWIRSRLSRKSGKVSGPAKLSAALKNRGIRNDAIKNALGKILDEETEFTLLENFMKKNKATGSWSLRSRLKYEGFSSTAINRYLEEILS